VKRSELIELLHEDDDIVVVNKPAQLAAIPGRAETDSVLERLSRQLSLPISGKTDPRLRVVHRLDKDTTGVMLFAKHFDAQRMLSHQFQNNTIAKEYLALVGGRVEQDSGTIDAPIAPHPTMRDRMAVTKRGRPAQSDWKVEQRLRQFTVVRVFPRTGKTHQIRVHFLHIGHPLAIDPLYGSGDPILLSAHKRHYRPTKGEDERPLIARLTLHAHRLRFTHPNGTSMTIEAPIPKDLRATIAQLGKV
jgi:23S rRNA pseudouridine955/2504/2580 synthase/23S rRNA pseudouridine1911/1915/1917 synthase